MRPDLENQQVEHTRMLGMLAEAVTTIDAGYFGIAAGLGSYDTVGQLTEV